AARSSWSGPRFFAFLRAEAGEAAAASLRDEKTPAPAAGRESFLFPITPAGRWPSRRRRVVVAGAISLAPPHSGGAHPVRRSSSPQQSRASGSAGGPRAAAASPRDEKTPVPATGRESLFFPITPAGRWPSRRRRVVVAGSISLAPPHSGGAHSFR